MIDRHSGTRPRREHNLDRAFSLLEVLVVISIAAFMLALLVPRLSFAREQSRRLFCAGNQRQWGVALHLYRDRHNDYLPTEGTSGRAGISKPDAWYNVLPPYLGLPPYEEFEGVNEAIEDLPGFHVWICPSKNRSPLHKSGSGKNQFHYGMNQVLDGMDSRLTPDFPDQGGDPIRATPFAKRPYTVFMFDIYPNSPRGHPKQVATKFHRDFANVLYLDGSVANFQAEDFVTGGDYRHGDVIWTRPRLYWGYVPPADESSGSGSEP